MSRSITDCAYSHKAIFIISLILVLTDCYCNKVLSLTHSICHFSYGYNDLNCTQFNFHQCSWVECVSWSSNSTSKTCLNYSTILKTNWNECMSRCCASDRLFPYQQGSFSQCQTILESVSLTSEIIIIACTLGVVLLIISIIMFCCFKEKIYNYCECIKGCCENISECLFSMITCSCFAITQISLQDSKCKLCTYNFNIENKGLEIMNIQSNWSVPQISNIKINEKINETICCVCLQSKPTLELECHHIFHRQCIVSCLNKKYECILCRSKKIDKIIVYCEICNSTHFQTSLKNNKNNLFNSVQICNNCKKIDQNNITIEILK